MYKSQVEVVGSEVLIVFLRWDLRGMFEFRGFRCGL